MIQRRIFIFFVLALSLFFIPTIIPVFCAIFLMWRYQHYFEGVLLGACIDVVYATGTSTHVGLYTFGMLALYIIVECVKPYIRDYAI